MVVLGVKVFAVSIFVLKIKITGLSKMKTEAFANHH
jgi:hypothetical protein